MAEPYLSQITMLSFNWPPRRWSMCDGQLLPIAQNQALYSLLGDTYGGDGKVSFALPDLRSRTPLHPGSDAIGQLYKQGQKGGSETVTLTSSQMPYHGHFVFASADSANSITFDNTVFSSAMDLKKNVPAAVYSAQGNLVALAGDTVSVSGNSQPHNNLQPSLTVNFCISLAGVFPSR